MIEKFKNESDENALTDIFNNNFSLNSLLIDLRNDLKLNNEVAFDLIYLKIKDDIYGYGDYEYIGYTDKFVYFCIEQGDHGPLTYSLPRTPPEPMREESV